MPLPATAETPTQVPLCVDLDGTLIKTDLLWESLVRLLRRNPLYVFAVFWWWVRGRANLKARIAERATVDAGSLPYHRAVVDFLRQEKSGGRALLLVTASDARPARRVAEHLGLFDEVLASDGTNNLRGRHKGAKLAERFGERGFDYAGNSSVDLAVWERAREAIVVDGSPRLVARAGQRTKISRVFESSESRLRALLRAMRPHQWVKNLILFVPLVTSHQVSHLHLALAAVLAFITFSLCASGVYVLNDLFDLEADRRHPTKWVRPFASGDLGLPVALVTAPVLLVLSLFMALSLSVGFAVVLGIYLVLTTSYSWYLKRVPLLDVFCLTGLYTIRLIAGHEALRIVYSFWLLVFSMFIFLSLALIKRFQELQVARQLNQADIKGRGYAPGDLEVVAMFGGASGYLAVLVLALYVNSPEVRILYQNPTALLLVCPLLLYWISRMWLVAHRGQMHEDPILFALKDKVSYLVGGLTLVVLWLATGR
jgi:4-hydroxybenzoate polyprenyltransferase